jgi:hypothetical protein
MRVPRKLHLGLLETGGEVAEAGASKVGQQRRLPWPHGMRAEF